jgi:glycosyltransferase involved in cell wall biosynthesis
LRASLARDDQILIAHVARLHYWKGQDYLLEALQVLKQRGIRNLRVIFVGEVYPGYESWREELRGKVRQFDLEQEIQFLGHREDIEAILQAVDIAVSPSTLPDPCPLVVAEAMAARLPVVATAAGGHLELIEDGVSGFLVPANDPATFADRLAQLLSDSALRRRLGAAARQRLETKFPASAFDQEILSQVRSLLAH